MNAYIATMIVVLAMDIFGKLIVLKTGRREYSPTATVLDTMLCVGLLAWACTLYWGIDK